MPSLAQDIKPSCKHIGVDLSLRPYITILVQINPKAVLILISIPYQILKILKIIGIKSLYPLYTYIQSYALVDHLLTPNRSVLIV
jgi:hypothetical protein